MTRLQSIFWLGTKEIRSFLRDVVLFVFVIYSFTFAIYTEAVGSSADVHNASLGLVDEDRSALSRRLANAFSEPEFQTPVSIEAHEVDDAMDNARFMFVLAVPPRFEQDVVSGRPTELQLNIDATAMGQAGIGAGYIQSIIQAEIRRAVHRSDEQIAPAVRLIVRRAFNPNGDPVAFVSLVSMVSQITMLTIILTGAALIREREHGTIEHLLVMPLTPLDIALAKVWANSLVILVATAFSMFFVIRRALGVEFVGSQGLFFVGVVAYLFFATALGIFLSTLTRSMGQFAMLVILVIVTLEMLSGGNTPVDSQPEWLQAITFFLPSRHFISFSQAIVYRGAGLDIVWPSLVAVTLTGATLFVVSLTMFRRQMS